MVWQSAAISGAAELGGGLIGAALNSKQNYKNRMHQWDMFNAAHVLDAEKFKWQAHKDERFARESTGWQFDDLMRAADRSGIHRLAALGGASSYQGTSPGSTIVPPPGNGQPGDASFLGDAVGEAIRMYKQSEQAEHERAMDKADLDIRRQMAQRLEDEAKLFAAQSRTEIERTRKSQTGVLAEPPTVHVSNLDPLEKDDPRNFSPEENITKWAFEGDAPQNFWEILEKNIVKGAEYTAKKYLQNLRRNGRLSQRGYEHFVGIVDKYAKGGK